METQTINGIYPVIKIGGFFISPDDIIGISNAFGGPNNGKVFFIVSLRFNIYEKSNQIEIGEICTSKDNWNELINKYDKISDELTKKWQSYLNEI